MLAQAQQSAKTSCQQVNWQTLDKLDSHVIYSVDSTGCGKKSKLGFNQHVIGRVENGVGGIYSLQSFVDDKTYLNGVREKMIEVVTDAKLTISNRNKGNS